MLSCLFEVTTLHTHRLLQGEKLVLGNGEESTHYPTMAGCILNIVVTKSHHGYMIVEAFHISGSWDSQYGMPTMHASPDYGYHVIPPSVSYDSCSYTHFSLPSIRVSCSFSMLNMTVKVGSAVTQSITPVLRADRKQRGLRERWFIPPTTDSSSTSMCFTTHGASVRSCLETSPSLYHMSPIVKSFITRWQGNYKRIIPKSVLKQRRRRRIRANERNKQSNWWRYLKMRNMEMRHIFSIMSTNIITIYL